MLTSRPHGHAMTATTTARMKPIVGPTICAAEQPAARAPGHLRASVWMGGKRWVV
jgi:hypothetical protein